VHAWGLNVVFDPYSRSNLWIGLGRWLRPACSNIPQSSLASLERFRRTAKITAAYPSSWRAVRCPEAGRHAGGRWRRSRTRRRSLRRFPWQDPKLAISCCFLGRVVSALFEQTFRRTHDLRNHRVQGDRAPPPFDESGNIAWTFEGEPITSREKRWLKL
jgi:hypothetical protein